MKNLVLITLVAIIAIVLGLMIFGGEEEDISYSVDEARATAQEWMENNSLTYTFDGLDLELVDEREVDDSTFEFTFSFDSRSAGFGDRTDQMTAQVITSHTTTVTVEDGEVIKAITDEVFSEVDGEMIDEESGNISEENEVSVYFLMVDQEGQEELIELKRVVDVNEELELQALKALLNGLTEAEKKQDYSTAINEGVEILSFEIEEEVANVDFSSKLDEDVAGSAMVTAIRNQIEETLKQFDSISEVIISIEGETEEVLQP
jgi:spore germination protein GerM